MADTANGTYALLAGGLKGVGPTVFLYRLPSSPTAISTLQGDWEYLGPLIAPAMRSVPPPSPWVADLGENWECPSFFTLGQTEFVIVGSEGKWTDTTYPTTKVPMYQVWFSGQLEKTEDGVEIKRTAEGIVDWGNFYAAQVFKVNDGRTLCIGKSFSSRFQAVHPTLADIRLAGG
jgi:sucrose-6-phosphate hydrolase SacC (GH32 family)